MSDLDWQQVRQLFDKVCDLNPEHWQRALSDAGASPELAAEVMALCDAQTRGLGLPKPVADLLSSLDPELEAGTRLGPWRILSTLAEGGMGRVYVAERADGQYALKVAIKRLRGMGQPDEDSMLRRERQILADLAHPNIARLLDGGMTPNGQPHLVMEYIEGQRIDEWCRSAALDLKARLRLFLQVCDAVAFAHRQLVLHCDLKPSNILVRADGSPVLLDFGISRLIDADAGASGGSRYMTPRYASPEQRRGERLSAASDIYSLGCVLVELIAPAPASAHGEQHAESPVTLPPSRRAERLQLAWARQLRGDLDAILRTACHDDPEQRYASVDAFARDIERHLARKPISLRQQRGYRALRFVQRHWPTLSAAAAGLAMAVGFTFSLQVQLERARAAEQRALIEAESSREVINFLTSVFEHADPHTGERADTTARALLEAGRREWSYQLDAQPEMKRRFALTLGQIHERIGLPAEALELLRGAEALMPVDAEPLERLALMDAIAHALWGGNRNVEAEQVTAEALALAEAALPPEHPALANALNSYGLVLNENERIREAQPILERALAIREKVLGRRSMGTAATLHNLGLIARKQGRLDAAAAYFEESLSIKSGLVPDTHPKLLITLTARARLFAAQGDLAAAVQALRQVLAIEVRRFGEDSLAAATTRNELASALQDSGDYAEAERVYRQALEDLKRLQGDRGVDVALLSNNLASLLEGRGNFVEALPLLRASLSIRSERMGPEHPGTARGHNNLARVLLQLGELGEARQQIVLALRLRRQFFEPDHPEVLGSELVYALLLAAEGQPGPAGEQINSTAQRLQQLPVIEPNLHRRVLRAQADSAAAGGDSEAELRFLERALAVVRDSQAEDHPLAAELLLEVQTRRAAEQRDADLIARASARVLETLVPDHPAVVLAGRLSTAAL